MGEKVSDILGMDEKEYTKKIAGYSLEFFDVVAESETKLKAAENLIEWFKEDTKLKVLAVVTFMEMLAMCDSQITDGVIHMLTLRAFSEVLDRTEGGDRNEGLERKQYEGFLMGK